MASREELGLSLVVLKFLVVSIKESAVLQWPDSVAIHTEVLCLLIYF